MKKVKLFEQFIESNKIYERLGPSFDTPASEIGDDIVTHGELYYNLDSDNDMDFDDWNSYMDIKTAQKINDYFSRTLGYGYHMLEYSKARTGSSKGVDLKGGRTPSFRVDLKRKPIKLYVTPKSEVQAALWDGENEKTHEYFPKQKPTFGKIWRGDEDYFVTDKGYITTHLTHGTIEGDKCIEVAFGLTLDGYRKEIFWAMNHYVFTPDRGGVKESQMYLDFDSPEKQIKQYNDDFFNKVLRHTPYNRVEIYDNKDKEYRYLDDNHIKAIFIDDSTNLTAEVSVFPDKGNIKGYVRFSYLDGTDENEITHGMSLGGGGHFDDRTLKDPKTLARHIVKYMDKANNRLIGNLEYNAPRKRYKVRGNTIYK